MFTQQELHHSIHTLLDQAGQIILGKNQQIRLAVCCLIAKGHLLIEDMPGVGKTTLSHALAKLFAMDYQRIQFTSDLLPADMIGSSIFDSSSQTFNFHPGPLFNQMILADEINRSTPKAQSALLEAMEEQQITVEGRTYDLPRPFFVIATQNPHHQLGTFPLPESQLDRFLMRISLGYPDKAAERNLLQGQNRHELLETLSPVISSDQLTFLQAEITKIHASDALLDYLQDILLFSRQWHEYDCGLSPRAGLALLNAARAWAFLEKRDAVIPEDIQTVLKPVAAHRLNPHVADAASVIAPILEKVAIP
ncbi:MAG: MoxR family ATPase [Methylococcaceae bacterium]